MEDWAIFWVTFSVAAAKADDVGRGGAGRGQAGPGGGLGDILGDILGGGRGGMPGARVSGQQSDPLGRTGRSLAGLLAGGAGGGVLADILSQFEQAGKGDAAKSWVSRGENIPVTPKDIESTFGSGIINELAGQFGMPRDELLKGLSQAMPEAVDALTPDGRLPTAEEITRQGLRRMQLGGGGSAAFPGHLRSIQCSIRASGGRKAGRSTASSRSPSGSIQIPSTGRI